LGLSFGLPAEKREGRFYDEFSIDRRARERAIGNNMGVANGILGV
jgi:hypothetical protein